MYSVFEKLAEEKGVSPSAVAIACGFAPSVISRWKRGESTPKADKMRMIADYFGVSLQYLMTGKDPIQSPTSPQNAPYNGAVLWNDDVKYIVETVNKWSADQQKRLRMYVEGVDRIVGGAE